MKKRLLLLLFAGCIFGLQAQMITGNVSAAEDGAPLPGVTVRIKNVNEGTITDDGGNFKLSAAKGTTLVFSYTGFEEETVTVGDQAVINVTMKSTTAILKDLVVVAYGTVKKSDLTGSVSSISSEDLNRTAPVSLDQALQGRAAGVQVTQVSGRPGGQTSIRIRGSSSINAGNEPLYVVDGMLITSDNGETNAGGIAGSGLNGLSSINPGDIERIEILKDASATALYGSRGSNGVVLITTKRGKAGRSSVSFDTYYGVQKVSKQLDMLNGEEFANYMNKFSKDSGLPLDARYLIPENIGEGTDWQKAIFRQAPLQSYQLSVLGGSEKNQFSISGGYYKQDGVILNSDFERFSLRTNLDQKINNWLKVGSSISLSKITSKGVLTGAQSSGTGTLLPGATTSALLFPSTLPVLDPTESGGYTVEDDRGRNIGNPVADALETDNISNNSRAIANLYGILTLAEGLDFKASAGIDGFSVKDNRFVPNYLKRSKPNNGDAVVATVDGQSWLTEFTLHYAGKIGARHTYDALIGNTYQGFHSERLFAFALDYPDNRTGWHNLGSALNPQPASTGESNWGIISYLGRLNYAFDNKILVTLTGRMDGASKFGKNNKYGFFPSGSIAWKLHEEEFIKKLGWFYTLKTRLSYGVIGNQDIFPYASLATVGTIAQGVFNNTEAYIGQEPLRYPNPELKWERTNQFDFGLDAEFAKGRLAATVDLYQKKTTDLLLFTPLPTTTGFSGALFNIGGLRNRGLELSLNSRNLTGAFAWQTDLNFSINRNEITELSLGKDIPIPGVLTVPSGWSILREGEAIGTFYGLVSDGIFQTNEEAMSGPHLKAQIPKAGDRRYKDLNSRDAQGNLTGQPDGIIDEADRTIIGHANPDFIWGLTNKFSWKGIDLSVFIQGVQGNQIVNAYLFEIASLNAETNVLKEFYDNRWTPENPNNEYPKINPSERNILSDAQVEDGSFIRLKNVTVGYTLPARWLQRAKCSNFRVYGSLNNLKTFTKYRGYDPEVNAFGQSSLLQGIDYGGYPLATSIIGGIQIGF
ncbi:MAG: TonB-dependent receptor [Saprospiraceae bacterium]|jgi:TonB-linked SusC/RagA family outer membrane protein|nr:TonB-dependent receptor [Saprospiraceae bacterium]